MNKPKIIFLAGGQGSRLGVFTKETPKAMMDINGTPFLQLLLNKYVKEGFTDFIISVNYLAQKIESYPFNLPEKVTIKFVRDPLGVRNKAEAVSYLFKNFVGYDGAWFINADTWIVRPLPSVDLSVSHVVLSDYGVDAGAQFLSSRPSQLVRLNNKYDFYDIGTPLSLELFRNEYENNLR